MRQQSKPQEKTSVDQRKNLRAPLIVLRVKMEEGQRSFFGYAKNISRGGLFIATANPREPGSRFQVEVPLPAPLGRVVQCACEVVWSRQYRKDAPFEPGMGLRFLDLPEEVAAKIDAWAKGQPG